MNTQSKIETDPRWMSIVNRDATANLSFVYAVKTTGIYCKPSCPSRRAKPENVTYFDTADEAEQAGFRACLRCGTARETVGRNSHAEAIARAC